MEATAPRRRHFPQQLLTGMLGSRSRLSNSARLEAFQQKRASRCGQRLARQILTVSRKQVVQPTRLDPNEIVRGLDRLLRRVVGAHIEFDVSLEEGIGTMRADAGQLEQVLLNLASNARDAMPTGGTLRIATQLVAAEQAPANDLPPDQAWILISVSDTGVGMPPEVRERIFEPFFTTKERGKGTGLGLALAYAMIEQAGGVVRVDSTLGAGTTFVLYFPRLDATQPETEVDRPQAEVLDGGDIFSPRDMRTWRPPRWAARLPRAVGRRRESRRYFPSVWDDRLLLNDGMMKLLVEQRPDCRHSRPATPMTGVVRNASRRAHVSQTVHHTRNGALIRHALTGAAAPVLHSCL
jgi:two-component sensor histidine kinase